MPITCRCGAVIEDSFEDGLRYLAHYIPDQDYEDMLAFIHFRIDTLVNKLSKEAVADLSELAENCKSAIDSDIDHSTRSIYQCDQCGRLLFEEIYDGDTTFRTLTFLPENDATPKTLLESKEGKWWEGFMGGGDYQLKGMEAPIYYLRWRTNLDSGSEKYSEWETLEKRYYEVFERLQAKRALRFAWLHQGKETLHKFEKKLIP